MLKRTRTILGAPSRRGRYVPRPPLRVGRLLRPIGSACRSRGLVSGIQIFGDAYTWWNQAIGKYETGFSPKAGAVLCFKPTERMRPGPRGRRQPGAHRPHRPDHPRQLVADRRLARQGGEGRDPGRRLAAGRLERGEGLVRPQPRPGRLDLRHLRASSIRTPAPRSWRRRVWRAPRTPPSPMAQSAANRMAFGRAARRRPAVDAEPGGPTSTDRIAALIAGHPRRPRQVDLGRPAHLQRIDALRGASHYGSA